MPGGGRAFNKCPACVAGEEKEVEFQWKKGAPERALNTEILLTANQLLEVVIQ